MAKAQSAYSSLFDEVEATPKETHYSVSSLTHLIKNVLETTFVDVTVEGEISNFLDHRSGHRYWTLKDEGAQLSCAFWKTRQASFDITNGQRVICKGRISLYAIQGKYQLDVFQIRPLGIGALQQAYDRLFKKLSEEGLFDIDRKRSIPAYPKKIGIVTSSSGAALYDVLTALQRRYPLVQVLLRPAAVQGVGAELDIAQGIKDMNLLDEHLKPDVLIVGRGGGSLEDLWSFNEEAVARAIYASKIPVISAVGHEVDVTIADMVADLRAPTPTAAAELATPDKNELQEHLRSAAERLYLMTSSTVSRLKLQYTSSLSQKALTSDVLLTLANKSSDIERSLSCSRSSIELLLERRSLGLAVHKKALLALDPKGVLARGYAIARLMNGEVISVVSDVADGEAFELILSDGSIFAKAAGSSGV